METFEDDALEILKMRERHLTEMIRTLQNKRRNVRDFIARYNAKNLKPVSASGPVAETAVATAQENSGGNNRIHCERCGRKWGDCDCQ